nr:hypothetical protein CR513_18697 [Ipomoea trifida]
MKEYLRLAMEKMHGHRDSLSNHLLLIYTSGSSEWDGRNDARVEAGLPFRVAKEADFLSLFSSSPLKPQSSFPSGEPQSDILEVIKGGELEERGMTPPRSIKLWLRFAKAADLEFMTAAATAAEESYPPVGDCSWELLFLATFGERPCKWDKEESREPKTSSSNSISGSKSRAFKAVFSLLPESCNAGGMKFILFCHVFPPIGDEQDTVGDIGGVEVVGISNEEPRAKGPNVAVSIELTEPDFGEGMAEPVEAYSGRSSSGFPLLKLGARYTSIGILARVTPPCVLPGMNKRALGPVMRVSPRARLNLETIHPELISPIYPSIYIWQRRIDRILFLLAPFFGKQRRHRFHLLLLLITELNLASFQQQPQCSPLQIARQFLKTRYQVPGLVSIGIESINISIRPNKHLGNLKRRVGSPSNDTVKGGRPIRATRHVHINLPSSKNILENPSASIHGSNCKRGSLLQSHLL